MIGRCPCGQLTYFLSISEYCPNEDAHRGGLNLRWSAQDREFWDMTDRRWRSVSEWKMESSI